MGAAAVSLLLLGTFGISLSYGMLLLLPLYVRELGGNEADFGVVLSSAAVPAVLCIGLLIRYPGPCGPTRWWRLRSPCTPRLRPGPRS